MSIANERAQIHQGKKTCKATMAQHDYDASALGLDWSGFIIQQ